MSTPSPWPPDPLPKLYAIVDAGLTARAGWEVPAFAAALLRGGAALIQLRAKSTATGRLLAWADRLVDQAARYGATIVVNDRADVARLAAAGGVHVGQDDLSVTAVRGVLGPATVVGLSTHTLEQLQAATVEPITYAALGPVFETHSKASPDAPVGLEMVRQAARVAAPIPVVGIGGITLDNAAQVIAAGASTVAVISDLLVGGDPERRVAAFVAALERCVGHPSDGPRAGR